MVAVKLLLLVAPLALALEQDLALVQLHAGKFSTDETEENPIDVLSHAKDALKAAGESIVSGVQHAFGHETKEEDTVSKAKANASEKHVVASKANATQKHAVAPEANASQKHAVAPKANASQQHVVAPKANATQKHAVAPKANASQKHAVAPKAKPSQQHDVAPKAKPSKQHQVAPKAKPSPKRAAALAARKARKARKHAASLRARKAKKQHQVPTQTVSFYLNDANTEYGDRIVIVGDDDQFGNWEPTNGMDLTTDESMFPKWKLENVQVVFPKATLEYKFVVLKADPKDGVEWEEFGVEANRKLTMSMDAIAVVNADYGVLA